MEADFIGHSCIGTVFYNVIEVNLEGRTGGTGRWGKIRKRIVNDVNDP